MNFLWLIGLFCFSAGAANARSSDLMMNMMNDNSNRKKLCGKNLADTLSLVCRGIYNEYINNSKKDVRFDDFSNEDYAYDQQDEPSWPFISQKSATALIGPQGGRGYGHRRYRRGVYDECCKKACSVNELRSYCASK